MTTKWFYKTIHLKQSNLSSYHGLSMSLVGMLRQTVVLIWQNRTMSDLTNVSLNTEQHPLIQQMVTQRSERQAVAERIGCEKRKGFRSRRFSFPSLFTSDRGYESRFEHMQVHACKCKQTLGHLVDEYLSESNLKTWEETRSKNLHTNTQNKVTFHYPLQVNFELLQVRPKTNKKKENWKIDLNISTHVKALNENI